MAENPNISITMEIVPNADHLTKLLSAVAGGVGPDIFDMNDTNLAVFITKDALAPMDTAALGYGSQEEYEALYVENSLNPFSRALLRLNTETATASVSSIGTPASYIRTALDVHHGCVAVKSARTVRLIRDSRTDALFGNSCLYSR